MWRKGVILARGSAFVSVLVLTAALLSGCISSAAPESIELGPGSETAVVVLGTTIDRNETALKGEWGDRPTVLLTQWQRYDPSSMQLVPGGARAMSMREDTVWSEETMRDPAVFVLEFEPGDYALIGVTIVHRLNRTTTTFIPLTGSNFTEHTNSLFPMASEFEMQGPVDPRRNFLFSVRPGQVVYIGDFDFAHVAAGNYKVVGINYTHDEAAAREAMKGYSGITVPMVSLNLTLPAEQAAFP